MEWVESTIHIHTSLLFWISFPFRSPPSIEESSLCYIVLMSYLFYTLYCLVAKSCQTLLWPHGLTGAPQSPLSMGFPRQESWSGLPFPSPGALPDPRIELSSSALAGRFFTTEPPGSPFYTQSTYVNPSLPVHPILLRKKWYRWTYLQSRNRDIDAENKCMSSLKLSLSSFPYPQIFSSSKSITWIKKWWWDTDTKIIRKITQPYMETKLLHEAVELLEGQEEWRNGSYGEMVLLGWLRTTEYPARVGISLLQPLWESPFSFFLSFFFFCNSCQVCSGAFNSSGLCHPFPKLCTLEKRMPDFPQALLDILTAFLLGERFLHHQHHFYILYNVTADDKSILLITHPACYNPHKKHEQLEKPWGDVKSYSWALNRNRNIFQALVSLLVPTHAWKQLPTGHLTRSDPVSVPQRPAPHLYPSPRRDGRHLEHPQWGWYQARRMDAKNR